MSTRNMGDFCAQLPSDVSPAEVLHLPLRIFEDSDGSKVVQGHWNLPEGSWLIPEGDELGFVQSTDEIVTLISCGADSEYHECQGEWRPLPDGEGLAIDPSADDGIVFKLPPAPAFIAIVGPADKRASVVVEAKGTEETYKVCTAEKCWTYDDTERPTIECGIFRCP